MTGDIAIQYILEGGVHTVEGWLDGGAITATLAIQNFQRKHNVIGNVAEIGIHHGKYFLVLKNLCRPDEIAIAIDVFEDQHLNTDNSGYGDRQIFVSNISAHSDRRNIEIIQCDSKLLDAERIILAGKGKKVRLFSIDGSHTMENTLSDLMLCGRVLTEGGVIVLDDFYNQEWPGVQEGFHHFMRKMHNEFAPIATGNNKLFICHRRNFGQLVQIFKDDLRPFALTYKNVVLWGNDAVSTSLKSPENVFSKDLTFPRNFFSFCKDVISHRCTLQSGWSDPELNGTWTIGEEAVVDLELIDPPRSGETMLHLNVIPFLHDQRTSRKIDVLINGSFIGSQQLMNTHEEQIVMPTDAAMLRQKTTLSIKIECPERPRQLNLSTDSRQIGIKVRSIKLV